MSSPSFTADPGPQPPKGPLPRHIAIIMDGNGRWAEQRGQRRIEGHRQGADSVRTIVTASREIGIEALTLYAFSSQNWSRPDEEVAGLMQLLYDFLEGELGTMLKNDIRLKAIGNVDRLPGFVQDRLHLVESKTAGLSAMRLTLALSYGGREELVAVARQLAKEAKEGLIAWDDIDEAALDRRTFTGDLPELDLIIRTSGEMRLSNFLLWQAAYAELVVTPVLWPEFGKADLFAAIGEYQKRERRFGKTGEQLRE